MAHRAGTARDEHATVVDRAVGEQAAVGGHERDTQGRGLLKPDALRHSDRLPGGDDHTLSGCPSRPLPGGVVDPHGLSDARILDIRPDRVDHPRAVLARNLRRERHNTPEEPSPSPPVRRIDRGERQRHPHLPAPRHGLGQIAEFQDLTGRTHAVIDRCAHRRPLLLPLAGWNPYSDPRLSALRSGHDGGRRPHAAMFANGASRTAGSSSGAMPAVYSASDSNPRPTNPERS